LFGSLRRNRLHPVRAAATHEIRRTASGGFEPVEPEDALPGPGRNE